MLKHLLVFLGMLGSLVWAGHRLYYGPAHYTHLSPPISAERNSATIWDETAQFLPRKSDDLRLQG